MESGFGNMFAMGIFALFYGAVISAILITFWKIHANSRDIEEIKTLLLDIKQSLEQMKK